MEDDEESEDEVETLREGLVAVKFPRELKQKIRNPWARALIVKVYGRVVGLSFLHSRLLSMWKPTGRLDCVDLEHGFYLTHFSLKDDYETVLKKGPWFIGETSSPLDLGSQTFTRHRQTSLQSLFGYG